MYIYILNTNKWNINWQKSMVQTSLWTWTFPFKQPLQIWHAVLSLYVCVRINSVWKSIYCVNQSKGSAWERVQRDSLVQAVSLTISPLFFSLYCVFLHRYRQTDMSRTGMHACSLLFYIYWKAHIFFFFLL